jgi:hypothetical protein
MNLPNDIALNRLKLDTPPQRSLSFVFDPLGADGHVQAIAKIQVAQNN